jgi:hypothetical protein
MAEPFRECMSRLEIGKGYDLYHDRLQFLVAISEIGFKQGRYLIDEKKIPYKTARKMMRDEKYKDLCKELRTKKETYEKFFGLTAETEKKVLEEEEGEE